MNSDKTISKFMNDVIRARAEAFRQNIKANAVLINKNLVKIPELYHIPLLGAGVVPPMICGLGVYDAGELLPEDYAFAVTHIETGEKELQRETVKAILTEINTAYFDGASANIMRQLGELSRRIAERYGIDWAGGLPGWDNELR